MSDADMSDADALVCARSIRKSFLGLTVLDGVSFSVRPGEIHALLGENGAGKSTLIKVLTGVHQPDGGAILVKGRETAVRDTGHAQELGIGTVYQEVNLLPNMTVAENLFVGRQPMRWGLVDRRRMERDASAILARYDLAIDARAELGRFSVAVQQLVAIARAVDLSGAVLILDEPTASLDRHEVDTLFAVMKKLRDRGMGIVFITHFLDQVYRVCDRITVLRNGRLVGTRAASGLPQVELVSMMLGRALEAATGGEGAVARAPPPPSAGAFSFSNYGRARAVAPFDLSVQAGEVVGMAGLLGSGRTETARLLFGIDKADSGTLTIEGRPARVASPRDAVRLGFALCPEDRKTDGIVGDLSVRENIALALQARRGWLRRMQSREQVELAERFVKALDIRTADIEKPVKFLSGGNQQKVVLARWLATEPRFMILDEPTRGIDVGAHAEIVRLINRLCDEGLALLVISSEIEEIVRYSSRVRILRDRAHRGDLSGEAISTGGIMRAIAADAPTVGERAGERI